MKTILLVEDDPIILRGLRENLEGQGFRVLSQRDGKKGRDLALKTRPDLAIVDVMLPSMNGFDICSSLKQAGCEFPIFLLTGLSAEQQRLQGLEHGADDYITKPFSIQELTLRVRNALHRSQQLGTRGALVDEEMRKAREIQVRSLPQRDPEVPGLEVHGRMIPALKVGGDYFDYINISKSKFGMVVADVSGKGMPAALYVQKMQGIVQSTKQQISSAREILLQLQQHLGLTIESSSFVTAIAAIFDLNVSTVEIARAGHLPALLKRRRRINELKPPGLWLGKTHARAFEQSLKQSTIPFKSGDLFVFYTDGIVESRNSRKAELGASRWKKMVSVAGGSAKSVAFQLLKSVDKFAAKSPAHDDKTIVVVKVRSLTGRAL